MQTFKNTNRHKHKLTLKYTNTNWFLKNENKLTFKNTNKMEEQIFKKPHNHKQAFHLAIVNTKLLKYNIHFIKKQKHTFNFHFANGPHRVTS